MMIIPLAAVVGCSCAEGRVLLGLVYLRAVLQLCITVQEVMPDRTWALTHVIPD